MHPSIAGSLPAVTAICRAHGVRRLWLFGSAARGHDFQPATSDLDFVVDFGSADLGPWMKRFFEFRRDLASALGRPVDLVLASSVGNRSIVAAIEATKVPIYAAA